MLCFCQAEGMLYLQIPHFSWNGAQKQYSCLIAWRCRQGHLVAVLRPGNRPENHNPLLASDAGSGILSLFSAQAGARKVYAVEASGMAQFARQLADANPELGSRIDVLHAKLEEVSAPCARGSFNFILLQFG